MEEFENQIRAALRKKEPSPWLEGRILAAANQPPHQQTPFWRTRVRWAMALSLAVVLSAGIAWQHQRSDERDRAAGLAAKERLQLALKITSVKLQQIQQEVVARNY